MADRSARILLVDDEQSIQTLLSYPLRKDGYEVVQATDGREALDRFAEQPFDLVVLDVMLPQLDGLEVCRRLRARSAVPIIMLTAKSEEIDKVVGLELGADDYITKPFSPRELVARVRAVLRRVQPGSTSDGILHRADLVIDTEKMTVTRAGMPMDLTTTELQLLATLARQPGRIFTRAQLLDAARGTEVESFERAIDAHIKNLRRKLEPDPRSPRYLLTVYGLGYKFAES
jgi:two-component system, OmpR family, response regulator